MDDTGTFRHKKEQQLPSHAEHGSNQSPSTPNVIPYMDVPGSSMYLFNNPAGTKDLGHILGKVCKNQRRMKFTGAGTVTYLLIRL